MTHIRHCRAHHNSVGDTHRRSYPADRRPTRRIFRVVPLLVILFSFAGSGLRAQPVRFSYPPAHSLTVACFPDDWHKTLVSQRGALAYDFGPGPYAVPLTEVEIGLEGVQTAVDSQWLEDPAVPIVSTRLAGDGAELLLHTWAVAGPLAPLPSRITDRVSRIGGLNGCIGWAQPPGNVDPAFRNAAWGPNRPIRYAVDVDRGAEATVALGLCEPYKWGPRTRMLELRVEGSPPRIIDPLAESPKNTPLVEMFRGADRNGDGLLMIEVFPSALAPDPNVFLNVFWVFSSGQKVTAEQILRGELSKSADVYFDCGRDIEMAAPRVRMDAITADVKGGTAVVRVRTRRHIGYDASRGIVTSDGFPFLLARPALMDAVRDSSGWQFRWGPHTKHVELVTLHGARRGDSVSFPDLAAERTKAEHFWRTQTQFPRGTITVPDTGVQYLLETSLRTLYQVREYVDGHPQFQPGPTVYRGLWPGDAFLAALPVLQAGDAASARQYLETLVRFQDSTGQIRVLYPHVVMMETPMSVAAVCWYALAAGDLTWLRAHWGVVERGIEWLIRERHGVGPGRVYSGLMPPGFVDGGVAEPTADFGSAWWTLIALEQAEAAAASIGKRELAEKWHTEWKDLRAAFLSRIARDMREDSYRNRFLPVAVGDTSTTFPQRGQYALLLPIPYSRLTFDPDPLMRDMLRGNLAMLDARREEGLIVGSGWLADAVWPWLSGVYAIAHLYAGDPGRAAEVLYAYADHAAPTGVWVEEQTVRAKGTRTGGDISDAEQSGVFISLVRNMIALEKGDTLEFLSGVPPSWFRNGSRIQLKRSMTRFGPVSFRLSVSEDGSLADFTCEEVDGRGRAGGALVHLGLLRDMGFRLTDGSDPPDVLSWDWKTRMELSLVRRSPGN